MSDTKENRTDEESYPPDRPGTPERPPYSPVTPVLAHLAPIPGGASIIPPASELLQTTTTAYQNGVRQYEPNNHGNNQRGEFGKPDIRPEPAPVPISESDNPDVIALRSAISILQLQKQKALNDIKTLDEMKKAAAADPEGFAQELVAGHLSAKDQSDLLVDTTMSQVDEDEDEDMEDDMATPTRSPGRKFGQIPNPQNVVRMPPINWAKYHIVGEPLDRMHEEQRSRPSPGEPRQSPNQRAPEHFIAAPYRPLTDKIESPTKGRSAKKDKKG